jgi:hypothetical protein
VSKTCAVTVCDVPIGFVSLAGDSVSCFAGTTIVSDWCPMSVPSARATMSNTYVPAGVPAGTVAVAVKFCVLGAGTGPTDEGENTIHEALAGAGLALATSRWTLS